MHPMTAKLFKRGDESLINLQNVCKKTKTKVVFVPVTPEIDTLQCMKDSFLCTAKWLVKITLLSNGINLLGSCPTELTSGNNVKDKGSLYVFFPTTCTIILFASIYEGTRT